MLPTDIKTLADPIVGILSGPVSGLVCAGLVAYISTRSWQASVHAHIKTLEAQISKIEVSHANCEKRYDVIMNHLLTSSPNPVNSTKVVVHEPQ